MANFIKIPLAVNPPRSFAAAAVLLNGPGGATALGASAPTETIDGGSGTGGTAQITINGVPAITAVTVSARGEGYKVGDAITITQTPPVDFSGSISHTLVAADLDVVEGSATNTYYPIDVDKIAFVDISSATTCEIASNNWDADAATSLKWTVTMDDAPVTTAPHLCADIAAAVNQASQAENSTPLVDFRSDAEVISVDLA